MTDFQFVMRKGPSIGKAYTLAKNELFVGRDISCDIAINDSEISRKHAHLVRVAEGYAIEDLGSTNGTFINEVRISGQAMLQPGMLVRMGDNVVLAYELAQDPQATIASNPAREPLQPAAPVYAPPHQPTYTPPAPHPQPDYAAPSDYAGGYAGQIPESPPMTGSLPKPANPNRRLLLIGCGAALFMGACICVSLLWYIDANFLWCDVFGGLIPACR